MSKEVIQGGTKRCVRGLISILPVILAVITVVMAGTGCGSESVTVRSKTAATSGQPQLTNDYVKEVAAASQSQPMEVREVTMIGESDAQDVNIGIDRPASLQDGSVTGVMASYGQHVFTSLFQLPEVSSVTITMYGVRQGVPGDEVAMRMSMNREMFEQADWSMFGPMMMSDMLNDYYVAPEIEANSY